MFTLKKNRPPPIEIPTSPYVDKEIKILDPVVIPQTADILHEQAVKYLHKVNEDEADEVIAEFEKIHELMSLVSEIHHQDFIVTAKPLPQTEMILPLDIVHFILLKSTFENLKKGIIWIEKNFIHLLEQAKNDEIPLESIEKNFAKLVHKTINDLLKNANDNTKHHYFNTLPLSAFPAYLNIIPFKNLIYSLATIVRYIIPEKAADLVALEERFSFFKPALKTLSSRTLHHLTPPSPPSTIQATLYDILKEIKTHKKSIASNRDFQVINELVEYVIPLNEEKVSVSSASHTSHSELGAIESELNIEKFKALFRQELLEFKTGITKALTTREIAPYIAAAKNSFLKLTRKFITELDDKEKTAPKSKAVTPTSTTSTNSSIHHEPRHNILAAELEFNLAKIRGFLTEYEAPKKAWWKCGR